MLFPRERRPRGPWPWPCPAPGSPQHGHDRGKCPFCVCLVSCPGPRYALASAMPILSSWRPSVVHQASGPNRAISPEFGAFRAPIDARKAHLSGAKHRNFQLLLCKLFLRSFANHTRPMRLCLSWVGVHRRGAALPGVTPSILGVWKEGA